MALEDGFEPPTAHGFNVPLLPLSYSSVLDPTPGIEPGRGGFADRRLPIWPGRVGLAPGEGLEPPSRGSGPRALPVRPPWCEKIGAPDGDRTRHDLLDRQLPPPGGLEGMNEERTRGGGAPGRICTSTALGNGVTGRWARSCPSRRALPPRVTEIGLPCLFGFQCADGQKKKGLASPGPLERKLLRLHEDTPGLTTHGVRELVRGHSRHFRMHDCSSTRTVNKQ